jgi:methionine sulfoxide reductase heme-binding subunit
VSHVPWFVARAAGLVAWTLLTASVFWGLSISTKVFRGNPRPAWMLDLHRYLGGLATIFTALHVGAIVADTYVHFDLMSILIPFASSWRPVAVAWGVVGMYLLLAVELTSLIRTKLPKKLWRATHVASFPLFGLATLHALTAGTDAKAWIVQVVVAVATVSVVAMTALRVKRASRQKVLAAKPRAPRKSDRVGELVDDRKYAVAAADL